MLQIIRRFVFFLLILSIILIFSISGYMYIEKWNFFDSLYMTMITIATIGFQEVHPLNTNGRIHTMIVSVIGIGFFSAMVVYFSSLFVEDKLRGLLQVQSMENKIKALKNHYIICGYGRIGREVCQSLEIKNNSNFIIIEKDPVKAKEALESGYLVMAGDATEDEILIEAGIKKATGIICALTDDALNVFITLSAKVLTPNINIIARADRVESVEKLKRAGAHMVVAPYIIGGRRMAAAVSQPFVLDFLDTIMHNDNIDLKLEQILVMHGSRIANKQIEKSNIREKSGAIIIAIKKASGSTITTPKPSDYIENGDMLIALGNIKQLASLKKMSDNTI